ncbi:hypothetical protein CDD80_2773 [Ophiocordyceps camponoti-rufipedis]|uniref:Uncharacterized protein n=1 Tax=Ophiocordyceps camponoti-rufipedis TaxID=2004952 RepID=A0A2C5Z677_9HYPO|nr:hypothetical protein CDD80_2773 [Ophiocordyceps camponoti-rufipedis]
MHVGSLLIALVGMSAAAEAAELGRRAPFASITERRQARASEGSSNNNFIDFCDGKDLTDGLQNKQGSCNPIPMGDIPAENKMISTVFTFPQACQALPPNQAFTIKAVCANIVLGVFTNATSTYYTAPVQVNDRGLVIGHVHFSVQDLGQVANPQAPPDPRKFAFFKGVNDKGQDLGNDLTLASAEVADGLPAGCYRVCSLTSAANHQCANMPVAQRGSGDDCQRFSVGNVNCGCAQQNNGGGNNGGGKRGNGGKRGGGGGGGGGQRNSKAAAANVGKGTARRN